MPAGRGAPGHSTTNAGEGTSGSPTGDMTSTMSHTPAVASPVEHAVAPSATVEETPLSAQKTPEEIPESASQGSLTPRASRELLDDGQSVSTVHATLPDPTSKFADSTLPGSSMPGVPPAYNFSASSVAAPSALDAISLNSYVPPSVAESDRHLLSHARQTRAANAPHIRKTKTRKAFEIFCEVINVTWVPVDIDEEKTSMDESSIVQNCRSMRKASIGAVTAVRNYANGERSSHGRQPSRS